jgi:eukaryotic-like serine/threonine-protein kinase
MPLSAGDRLGPYEILAPLGAGGMGLVYKARDTRLDRTVAIKVSASQFSERFEREARAVAALNHPHICQLYDVGPDYLVMEFIDGQPLSSPMPADQAVKFALQILSALEAAHRKGIVHRDLKPGNVLLTKSGVKLLDFGLAKQQEKPSTTAEQTLTIHLTAPHTVLGTPQYMAPEQIEGRDADARTDIFAFGCVLYELLTGRKAFEGKTPSTVMASVLATEPPPITSVQSEGVAPALERVVRTCLAKDSDERWQSARDVRHALEWALAAPAPSAAPAPPGSRWLPWTAAALLAAALPALWFLRPKPPEASSVQLELDPPEGTTFGFANLYRYAISPDGTRLAFVAVTPDGKRDLWLRILSSSRATRITGTENATGPFWAPDSRWLGFSANGKLMKVDTNGGPTQVICDVSGYARGTWNRDGIILFGDSRYIIRKVPASGGTSEPALSLEKTLDESRQLDPQFLPDGRRFLYASFGKTTGVVVASLDGSRRFVMEQRNSPGFYVPSGDGRDFLLFIRGDQLMAQPFDPGKATASGEARTLAEGLSTGPSFSPSNTGTLVYRRSRGADAQLTWFDRDGKEFGTMEQPGRIFHPRLSPDQKKIVFSRTNGTIADLWLFDTERRTSTRFTFDGANSPTWSPDGQRITYYSRSGNKRSVMERAANGMGKDSVLLGGSKFYNPLQWSRDGGWLMLSGGDSLAVASAPPNGAEFPPPVPFPEKSFEDRDGTFSPDGRWIAYSSMQTGRREVFVQTMPNSAAPGKWQISNSGGSQPAWRGDGKELFFLSAEGKMMSVPVESAATSFQPGVPKTLFQTRLDFDAFSRAYDVSADGKRFLLANPVAESSGVPITVILNWPALLKK